MEEYFDTFAKLLSHLEHNLTEEKEVDFDVVIQLLDQMRDLTNRIPKLQQQKKDVEFYKKNIESFFRKGRASGYKVSFFEQLKLEKESLQEFAKTHDLF